MRLAIASDSTPGALETSDHVDFYLSTNRLPFGRGRVVTRRLSLFLATILATFLAVHLIFPDVAIDTTALALLAMFIVVLLLPFAKSISLPGGVSFELQDVQPAKEAVGVAISDTAIGREEISVVREFERPETWRRLLSEDSNIALAGLRIEIERKMLQLAEKAGAVPTRPVGLAELTRILRQKEILSGDEEAAVRAVVDVCNRAVHARWIAPEAAAAAAELGDRVLRMLDSKGDA